MPELVLKLGDNVLQTYVFDKDIMSIGRSRDNDIVIENLSVSRNHARIRRQAGKYILTDLNSANGTFVNGVRVSKTEIVDDDLISMGKHKLQFVNQVISEEEMIVDSFGADRTMVVDRTPMGVLCIVEGKSKGQEFQLTKFETSIGKAGSNDVVIADDWFLSKKQVIILRKGPDYEIQDLGGFRKTKVNGQTLTDPLTLKPGDSVEIGSTRFVFQLGDEFAQPAPEGRVPQEMALEDSIFSSGISMSQEMAVGASAASGNGTRPEAEAPSDPMLVAAVLDEEPAAVNQNEPGIEMISLGHEFHQIEDERPAVVQDIIPGADVVEIAKSPDPEEKPATPAVGKRKKNKRRDFSTERFSGTKELEDIVIAPPSDVPPPAAFYGVLGEDDDIRTFVGSTTDEEKAVEVEGSPQSNADESGSTGGEQGASSGISDESLAREVALWEAALTNKSPVIRQQAARRLKKLTGRQYET